MKHYNLIVAGGGLTGVAAAVSAAKEGMQVLLVERMGSLGGALSNGLVYPFMKHSLKRENGEIRLLSAGVFSKMCQRHKEIGGDTERGWQPELFKIVLDEMIVDAGVDILFHAMVIGVTSEQRSIKSIQIAGKNGPVEVTADFFIDATGDGDLMYLAGCDYQLGRESDKLCQPMTTCFRLCGVDIEKFKVEAPGLQKLYKEWQKEGKITNPRENILFFYGLGKDVLHLNTTRIVKRNPVNDLELSFAEIEARRQVYEMYSFLCKNSEACANCTISSIASEIGVRESRKLKGEYILTGEDIKSCVDFDDSIALGNYDIDIHNPEGTGTYIYHLKAQEYFRIPYRCLVPKEIDNLLVAGRCLSATHEAHSAVRIMPICACLGEAAGIAAAEAVKSNKNVRTLNVALVQSRLMEGGAQIH